MTVISEKQPQNRSIDTWQTGNETPQIPNPPQTGINYRLSTAAACHYCGRLNGLTYLRRLEEFPVLAWIEEPGTPPHELYRELPGNPPLVFPVRQWVKMSCLYISSVPDGVELMPVSQRFGTVEVGSIELNREAIVEENLWELWQRLQGKRLEREGYPWLYHQSLNLWRIRVRIWDGDRYCGLVSVPLEWMAN
ncbi:MAG: hypothetical protein WBF52_16355 [Geitlerinemataceae cyanobacterium]